MAHHLAELIDTAEKGATAAERLRARKSAAETILKVWEHRTSLPGNAYPLAAYKDVLSVLDLLRPDKNPFWRFRGLAAENRDHLAAALFDDLSRLIIALLLMKVPSRVTATEVGSVTTKNLSVTEQAVLAALERWGELFASTAKSSERTRKRKRTGGGGGLNEVALRLIDELAVTLGELRAELQKGR